MTKRLFNYLFNICLVVLLVFAAVGAVQAAPEDYLTLTFDYDASRVKNLIVEVDGDRVQPDPNATNTYAIPVNHATVTITVEAAGGYQIESMENALTNQQVTPNAIHSDAKKVYSNKQVSDMGYKLNITPKRYTIVEMSAEGILHDTVFGTETYDYKSDVSLTLRIPTYEGYKFLGWQITDGNKINTLLEPNSAGTGVDFATSQYPDNATGQFTATPKWEGIPQDVTRKDFEYDPTGDNRFMLGSVTWQVPNGTTGITGLDGDAEGYKKYVGYYDFASYANDSKYYKPLAMVGTITESNKNLVERYYTPITYTLVYDWNGVAFEELTFAGTNPTEYVYNTAAQFFSPTHAGYHFAGWKVYIQKDEGLTDITADIANGNSVMPVLTLNPRTAALAEGNTDNKIVLKATWTPKRFALVYDWNGADEDQLTFAKPAEYVYDTALTLPDPIRTGYIFDGWLVNSDTTPKKGLTLDAECYTADITLKATWTAKKYTVTLNANGGAFAAGAKTELKDVTFDAPVDPIGITAPTRTGYTFLGFTATKDGEDFFITVENDGSLTGKAWTVDAETPVLYARWAANPYDLILNIPHAAGVTVSVNGGAPQAYTPGEKLSVHYDDVVKFTVTAESGYKVTAVGGGAVAHAALFTYTYDWAKWGAKDYTLTLTVLPVIANPFDANAPEGERADIDYVGERFVLPTGSYLITCGNTTLNVTVGTAGITVNGEAVDAVIIPESFFGQSIAVIKRGDATSTADSDAVTMTLAARPAAPNFDTDIAGVSNLGENAISILLKADAPYGTGYEFAISTTPTGEGLVWKSVAELEAGSEAGQYIWRGLNAGTVYYVYMRVGASNADGAEHPHGVSNDPNQSRYETAFADYFNTRVEDIRNLLEDTDGEMAKALVNAAVTEANNLPKPSADFYAQLEAIYTRTQAALPFAREQDAAIARLSALRDSLVATGEFSAEGVNRLDDLLSTAVSSVKAATLSDEVSAIADKAASDMKRVDVHILTFGDMVLNASQGMTQGSKLFMQAITDLSSIIASVDSAVAAGRVELGGNSMTPAEAIEMLQSLNVAAAYTLRLDGDFNNTGVYHLRLKLPEELRTATGLQVAYYDESTGMLELLDTTRDGNYLEFTATRIADFVILGDPTVQLTSLIIALGLILACQLLAIIVLLARRARSAKYAATHACTALPLVALTVRFLPANGLIILPILGVAVVICQILLMYLLLSSDMFHRSTRRRTEPTESRQSTPVMASADETDPFAAFDEAPAEELTDAEYTDEAYIEQVNPEEEYTEDAEDYTEEYTEDADVYAEEDVEQDGAEDTDVYVNLATGEVFGDTDAYEDFIEPAAATRYSLPDEDEESIPTDADVFITEDGADFAIDDGQAESFITEDGADFAVEDNSVDAPTWDFDLTEPPEQLAADIPEPEENDPNFITEPETTQPQDEDVYFDYDAPATGDPAEDLPQEDPATGEKPKYE